MSERDFYQTLAAEAREHHLIFLDYYEYLKDPAEWFVSKEHPSLDGDWVCLLSSSQTGHHAENSLNYVEDKEVTNVPKYKCSVCGYIYDPELGDPDGDIEPGTLFEEIPADWMCPICGATKDEFKRME